MNDEEVRAWDQEYRSIRATHSWLYGHNFVRCLICGASSGDERARQPCTGFHG